MWWNMLRNTRKPLISLTFVWVAVCAFLYLLTGIRTGSEIINPSQLISTRIKNCQLQKVRVGFAKTHKTASRWNGSRSLQSMWQRRWLLFGVNPSQSSNELTGLFFPAPFKISSSNMVYHTIWNASAAGRHLIPLTIIWRRADYLWVWRICEMKMCLITGR